MLFGQARGVRLGAHRRADAPYLIGGKGDAHARAANEDAHIRFAILHLQAGAVRKDRVVAAVGGVGADILYLKAMRDQVLTHGILHFNGRMVAANDQLFHRGFLSRK